MELLKDYNSIIGLKLRIYHRGFRFYTYEHTLPLAIKQTAEIIGFGDF